jgi:Na+/proline symporter
VNGILLALLGYLAAQLALGLWVARGVRTESDYLVGGRRLGYPLTIASIFATWFGAETCIASAGRAYRDGVALTTAEPFAYGLCLILMGAVFAVPLWRRRLTTLADLFRTRFSATVEHTAAVILIPSSVLWAAAQMRGFGHVLTTATAVDLDTAVLVAAGFCVLYTGFGGLLADAVTDLVQGIVLTVGLVVVLGGVVAAHGGVAPTVAAATVPGKLALAGAGADVSTLALLEEWAIPVAGSVLATELVSRVIAARSPAIARNGALLAGGLYILIGLVPVAVGLAAAGLVPAPADAEQLLPGVARAVLPTALYVVFAGGLISAILSTIDTTLLVSAGLLAHNVVAPALRITDDGRRLRLARAGVVAFGAVAYVLALRAEGVFALVEQASAFGSAGALVTVSFGLFTPWGGPRTALVTLVGGMLAYLAASYGGAPYPFLTSLAAALTLYVGGALSDKPSPASVPVPTSDH